MYSPEETQRILDLRQKIMSGAQPTLEEVREGLMLLRKARANAHAVSAKSKTAKAPVDSNKLLDELGDL